MNNPKLVIQKDGPIRSYLAREIGGKKYAISAQQPPMKKLKKH